MCLRVVNGGCCLITRTIGQRVGVTRPSSKSGLWRQRVPFSMSYSLTQRRTGSDLTTSPMRTPWLHSRIPSSKLNLRSCGARPHEWQANERTMIGHMCQAQEPTLPRPISATLGLHLRNVCGMYSGCYLRRCPNNGSPVGRGGRGDLCGYLGVATARYRCRWQRNLVGVRA